MWPSGLTFCYDLPVWPTSFGFFHGLLIWPSVMAFWFGLLVWPSGKTIWCGLVLCPSGVAFSCGLLEWHSVVAFHPSSERVTNTVSTYPTGMYSCLSEFFNWIPIEYFSSYHLVWLIKELNFSMTKDVHT